MAQRMTKAEAETCWEKHCSANAVKASATKTTAGCAVTCTSKASATSSGCPGMVGVQKASVTTGGKAEACTKDECIDKLIKAGFSKEDAEKKYTTCMASGKCTGSASDCYLKTSTK